MGATLKTKVDTSLARSRTVRRRPRFEPALYAPFYHARRVGSDADGGIIGAASGLNIEWPGMPGANNASALDISAGETSACVRACIVDHANDSAIRRGSFRGLAYYLGAGRSRQAKDGQVPILVHDKASSLPRHIG